MPAVAVGLPIWTPHVWADTVWEDGVWRDETTPPPPPPPPAVDEALSGGWLTPAHLARLRGWTAPPWRPSVQDEETADALVSAPRGGESGPRQEGRALPPAFPLAPLLATARALPPLDWAPLQALALGDARRRQARAQAEAEEEDLLVLLLLLEEVDGG